LGSLTGCVGGFPGRLTLGMGCGCHSAACASDAALIAEVKDLKLSHHPVQSSTQ
jgi:hypothetical protein